MTIATVTNNLRQLLNQATPAQLATFLQILKAGDLVSSMPRVLRRCNPNAATTAFANPYVPSGCQSVAETQVGSNPSATLGANIWGQLPDDAKASVVLRASAIAGTSTPQELTCDSPATSEAEFVSGGTLVPVTLHIGVAPSGDIVTLGTDAWTSVDVLYIPEQVDVVEHASLSPASAVVTLPTADNIPGAIATTPGAVVLMEAEILTGTVTGKCVVTYPSNTAPGTSKQACLNLARTQVLFKVSDAPTTVRLKLGVARGVNGGTNFNALLEAAASVF